jgi:hypothetical protein
LCLVHRQETKAQRGSYVPRKQQGWDASQVWLSVKPALLTCLLCARFAFGLIHAKMNLPSENPAQGCPFLWPICLLLRGWGRGYSAGSKSEHNSPLQTSFRPKDPLHIVSCDLCTLNPPTASLCSVGPRSWPSLEQGLPHRRHHETFPTGCQGSNCTAGWHRGC